MPKNECNITHGNEFMRKYIGGLTCGNDYTFEFTLPPHYQRNVMVEMIFMNDNNQQTVQVDFQDIEKISTTVGISGKQTRMQRNCQDTQIKKEQDFDQMYRGNSKIKKQLDSYLLFLIKGSWKQNSRPGTNFKITINESCTYYWGFQTWTDKTLKNLKIGSLQLNISLCDPSCLTCADGNTCITCSENQIGNTCSCKNNSLLLHKGICVPTCPTSEFYFPYQKKCIFLQGCLKIDEIKGSCSKCSSGYYLFEGFCSTDCPLGFENIVQGNVCGDQNQIAGGLLSNNFSQLEINYLGISMNNYFKSDDNSSIFSLCGEYQLLGGFFINQKGTTITFPKYTTNKKYVLIDMPSSASKADTQISVTLGSAVKNIDATSAKVQNICGLEDSEWIGVFSYIFDVLASDQSNLQFSIMNNNSFSQEGNSGDTPNQHSYFGIREISIVAFNCKQKNCIECNSANCTKCQEGYYLNNIFQCIICQSDLCKGCIDGSGCTSCIDPNMSLISKQCLCNSNYYLNISDKSCLRCQDQFCEICSGGNKEDCTSCIAGKYLKTQNNNSNLCEECNEEGFFKDERVKKCLKCSQNCKTCIGEAKEKCTECNVGYSFSPDNSCQVCPQELHFIENNNCKDCHSDCQKCIGPKNTDCTLCNSNFYISNAGVCQSCDLMNGFYVDGAFCKSCDQSCSQCKSSEKFDCKICAQGLNFVEKNSKQYCEVCDLSLNNFLDSTNTCKKCYQDCQRCDGEKKINCLSCKTGWYLYEDKSCNEKCLTEDGMFIDPTDQTKCNKCQKNCKKCDGIKQNQCLACLQGFFMKDDSSCDECKESIYFKDTTNSLCLRCHETCGSCKGLLLTDCLTCQQGYFLVDSKCIKCEGKGVSLTPQNDCIKCSDNCQRCNENGCILCDNSMKIDEITKQCINCQDMKQYFIDGIYCRKCHEACEECFGGTEEQCKKCAHNYFQLDSSKQNKCSLCPQSSLTQLSSLKDHCDECQWQCTKCNSPSAYCKSCNCKKCSKNYFNFVGKCLQSCQELGKNYEENFQLGICQCEKGYNYQIKPKNQSQGGKEMKVYCSQDIPIGFYCNSEKVCQECTNDNSCFTCSSLNMCSTCINGFFLWEGGCFKDCFSHLRVVPSKNKGVCECEEGFILINKEDSLKPVSQNYCDRVLEVSQFEIENILISSDQNNSSSYKQKKYQNNLINIKMNRQPTKSELLGYEFYISDTTIVKDKDYKVSNIYFKEDTIYIDIEAEANYQISSITMKLNQQLYQIEFPFTILVSKQYVKNNQNQEQQIKKISSAMENMSQALTVSSNKGVQAFIDFLKAFQLLCYTSNFVQLLAPLYLIKDYLPPQARYGTILGASFVFTTIPPPQQLQFTLSNKDSKNNIVPENFENKQNEQVLRAFGLDSYLYSNFIFIQLIIVIISLCILLCLIARHFLPGKQYTLSIVNKLSNFLASYIQGSITVSLFAITLTIYDPIYRYLGLFQLLCNFFFIVELFYLFANRTNEYLNAHIPNCFQNLNYHAKGAKSYLLVSLLKKYLVITLLLSLNTSPYTCTIIIGVIFNLKGLYLLYYRFFQYMVINVLKIVQEFMISTLFFVIAASIKQKEVAMEKEVISNNDLDKIQNYGKTILVFFLACLLISFSLFIIRLFLSILNIVKSIYKKREDQKKKQEEIELMLDQSIVQLKNIQFNQQNKSFSQNNESQLSIYISNHFIQRKQDQLSSQTNLN